MKKFIVLLAAACAAALGQNADQTGAADYAQTQIRHAGETGPAMLFSGSPTEPSPHGPIGHPYTVKAFHPDGTEFYTYSGFNMRTSAGTTWQSQLMGDTSTPTVNAQCNYLALTNTAITPAEADTTLSGEITTNGLARAQGTYTDASGALTVPSAPTVSPQGTTGATSYWYWVVAVNQGIPSTVSSAGTTTTANATLTSTNFDRVSWTPVPGASAYYVFRTTSSSAPTGATTAVAGTDGTSQPNCSSTTCFIDDIANTLGGTSVTIPASNLTNFGKFTLVHTWTATATQSAQAFGVLTAASSGTMCFEGTFTQVTLNNGDTFQLTETVYF